MSHDLSDFENDPEVYDEVELSLNQALLGIKFVKNILSEDRLTNSYVLLVMEKQARFKKLSDNEKPL